MKRITAAAALVATTALVGAAAAGAALTANTSVSYAYAGYVYCANGGAGEYMTGTIDAHILSTSTMNGQIDASKFQFATRGSLVGRVTGDNYRLSGIAQGSDLMTNSDMSVLTFVNRYRLIGPGPGNNLVVKETAHLVRQGDDYVVSWDAFSVDCS